MKKLILGITLLAIATMTTFLACKKDTNVSTVNNSDALKKQLLLINSKHVSPKNLMRPMTDQEKSARTAATIAADALGAGDGAALGGKIGGLLGGIAGAGFGAGFGAGIGAATASYLAWKSLTHDFPLPPGQGSAVEQWIVNSQDVFVVPNPSNNPNESVGLRHNQLLKSLFASNATFVVTTDIYTTYSPTVLNTNEQTIMQNDQDRDFINNYNWAVSNVLNNTDHIARITQPNTNMRIILTSFIDGLQNINTANLSDIYAYVNDYEANFITYNGINSDEKTILMSIFATAKHSAALWVTALNSVQ